MLILAVGVGGALGAVGRYLLSGAIQRLVPGSFPYGTLVVNVIGGLTFGLLVGLAEGRVVSAPLARAFILTGILGGFTTFSAFTYETFELVRTGQMLYAALNVAGQVTLAFIALWAGLVTGRAL